MKTSKAQETAITHFKGPLMVLAGPGSGKTFTITQRTKYLVEHYKVNPSNILVITFTKAAATEMRERFKKLMNGQYCPVTFGTFHAVFFQILKLAYNFTGENIIREDQKYAYLKELIARLHLEFEDEGEFIASILSEISLVKNEGVSLSNYYSKNCPEEAFRTLFLEYQRRMESQRLIDFDDMLTYTYELFLQREDILSAWQKKFQYILIDEFQDINKIQYEIVKMLAKPQDNLFIVGDDDQSIYRFRGAKPEIMLHFQDDYPTAKAVLLDVNYRSKETIVNPAVALINHNKERYQKKIRANREAGREVLFQTFKTQREESRDIIERIQAFVEKEGNEYKDVAVLFRTNTQPRFFMERMAEYNIPFRTRDNIPNIYEHWIAKDLFAYIRIGMGSRQRSDFLRIMNRPKRYLSRDSLEQERVDFDEWIGYYEEQRWMQQRLEQLAYDIDILSGQTPYSAINYIRKGIGYDDYVKEYADYRRMNAEDLLEVLDELQQGAKEYKNFDAWFLHIEEYAKELEALKKRKDPDENSVSLSTLHSAKGLEYKQVFIMDVNEGIMPYKKAVLDVDLEEERRMFYVGMTRAKDELYLYAVENLNNKKMEISRFIKEAGKSPGKK